jgi:ribosome-associated toxin RatA of RatAB toxin-antitoxin module
MRTVDRITARGSVERAFRIASEVERWPEFLPHYRWVRMLQRHEEGGLVEMSAWRQFGPLKYPTWWVSEMTVIPSEHRVLYKHVKGITTDMEVEWRLTEIDEAVDITIVHEWTGPRWPLIGRLAAELVIGPVFISAIAGRTLAGVKHQTEHA